jgi:hypothetical protein
MRPGFTSVSHSGWPTGPVHSTGSDSLSRPRFARVTIRSGAGISHLLAIAYGYNALGLGPDSPWDD